MNARTRIRGIALHLFALFCLAQLSLDTAAQTAQRGTAIPQPATTATSGDNMLAQQIQRSVEATQPQTSGMDPTALVNPAAATNAAVYQQIFGSSPALEQAGAQLAELQAKIEQSLPVIYSLMSGRSVPTNSPTQAGFAPGQVAAPVLPQPIPFGQVFLARAGTNAFAMDAETMRLLYALHNQLQLALPVLRTVNGLPVASGATNTSLPFANRFTAIPIPSQPLVPTGR